MANESLEFHIKFGGSGSGHEGHKGRPGEVGGSLPGKGGIIARIRKGKKRKVRIREREKRNISMKKSVLSKAPEIKGTKRSIVLNKRGAEELEYQSGNVKMRFRDWGNEMTMMTTIKDGKEVSRKVIHTDDVLRGLQESAKESSQNRKHKEEFLQDFNI